MRKPASERPDRGLMRGYVRAAHGMVHYRKAGSGPAVVLLHDSPRSSLLHLPLLRSLADRFTVFALDTPGYGRSDPLPAPPRPEIPDFARALAGTLDALGLVAPVVYAYHTSSKIALECAVAQPGHIGHLVIDGISLPPLPVADAFIEAYMSPFAPDADGAYIARQWTKVRDLHRFFPWFERSPERRTPFDEPGPAAMHEYALDYFMAGPHYSDAYAAAMRYRALPALGRLRVPATFMARADDVLLPYLDIVESHMPQGCRVERLPADRGRWMRRLRAIFAAAHAGRRGEHRPSSLTPPRAGQRYVGVPGRQAHVIDRGDSEVPVLFLHAPPGGARSCAGTLEVLAGSRRVVAPDLPGCGASDALAPGATFGDWVSWLVDVAVDAGLETFDVLAQGLAGAFALGLAGRVPQRVRRVVIDGLPLVQDPAGRASLQRRYAPAITPRRDGAHFHATFQRLRDEELQWPWYESRAGAARRVAPDLDPERLHLRLVDTLATPRHSGDACRAALSVNPAELAAAVRAPLLVLDLPGDPAYAGARELARLAPQGVLGVAVPDRGDRDRAMARFLDDS